MKPNDKQLEIIKACNSIFNSWSNTNDINSPTLSSDITEELDSIEFSDNTVTRNVIETCLYTLLIHIQNEK